jgi:hypothetical protein
MEDFFIGRLVRRRLQNRRGRSFLSGRSMHCRRGMGADATTGPGVFGTSGPASGAAELVATLVALAALVAFVEGGACLQLKRSPTARPESIFLMGICHSI